MESHQDQVAVRNAEHRVAYEALKSKTLNLQDELVESDLTEALDVDGKGMQLFEYQYQMGSIEPFSVLVKKGSDNDKLTSEAYYCLLRFKHHQLLLPVINFYEKGSNRNGWFVLSPVKGSLRAWLETKGCSLMFKGSGAKRDMAPLLRAMVLDLWGLIVDMFREKICPLEIKLENFFVKFLHEDVPRIQLLLTHFKVVNKVSRQEEWDRIWDEIDSIIAKCCEICGTELSANSKRFCKYARECDLLLKYVNLKNFPDEWGSDQKACYLYHMVSGSPFLRYAMRSKINEDSRLQWPKGDDGYLLPVIERILSLPCNMTGDDQGRQWSKYDTEKAYDYIQVMRNHHKHFDDLPENIKGMLGGTREGLIQRMEEWEPNIWVMLYVAVGPAGRQWDG